MMPNPTIKDVARELIERLPENATWDDVEYEIYVRRAIEAGVEESDAGATVPVEEIRREFGLSQDRTLDSARVRSYRII